MELCEEPGSRDARCYAASITHNSRILTRIVLKCWESQYNQPYSICARRIYENNIYFSANARNEEESGCTCDGDARYQLPARNINKKFSIFEKPA
jgi:hypothetical protein